MNESSPKVCPDCRSNLEPVTVYSKTDYGTNYQLQYASGDAGKSWFAGRYPVKGNVDAFLYGNCGRMLLYGRRTKENA